MSLQHIARTRLHQQQISQTVFNDPARLAEWFGAMQAQDYPNVRWALGVRLPETSDESVSAAIDSGKIIRTHILRPTWHLVAADDIRWMTDLSGPRLSAQIKGANSRIGITADIIKQSQIVLEKSLRDRKHLTRAELVSALAASGIHADSLQAAHLMMEAEVSGLICNGAMRDKQFTYALLEERVPNARRLARQDAVVELVRRYFQSHGPATVQDFVWWSGLTLTDARAGLEAIKNDFVSETIDNQVYWMPSDVVLPESNEHSVHLLPSFDEFMVAYKNRDASLEAEHRNIAILGNGIFKPIVVVNGKVAGIWQRNVKKDQVLIEINLFSGLSNAAKELLEEKAKHFGRFLGHNVNIQLTEPKN